jgi:hypothetical protein
MGLEYLEFVLAVEREFGLKIPDEATSQLETMGKWHEYLVQQLPELSPDDIWERQLDKLCKLLGLNENARMKLTPDTHCIGDLNMG